MALADFTAAELENLTNSVIDFYMKGPAKAQSLQNRPFLAKLKETQSTFPGGKEFIRGNVKGDYTTTLNGYSYDDTVEYTNPANIRQYTWPWFELHGGVSVTHTELKHAGITVTENNAAQSTSSKSNAAVMRITNILEDKLDDMTEGTARAMNLICMRDGTQSAKEFPGLRAIVRDNPTVGIVGGIDAAANVWWRNRARTAASGGVITTSTANLTGIRTMQFEMRQLRRFGGAPNFVFAGSGAIDKLESEVQARGSFTDAGWAKDIELSMGDLVIRGVGKIVYDPTLDDEGLTNRMYVLDCRHLMLKVMDGEDMKVHSPARPENKYVMYRAVTWTGTMMARQLNCHGVYDFA